MAENFPNLKKETDIQIQKAQKVPNKMNTIRSTQTPIIIKKKKRHKLKGEDSKGILRILRF